jgi:hypothetical protein
MSYKDKLYTAMAKQSVSQAETENLIEGMLTGNVFDWGAKEVAK